MAALDRTVVTNSAASRPLGRYSLGMSINPRKLVYVTGQGVWTPTETRWGKATRRHRHAKRLRISVSCWRAPVPISAMLSSSLPTSSPVPPFQGYLDGCDELYPHMYPYGDFPPNTLHVVAGMVREDYLVEIKAVAALP